QVGLRLLRLAQPGRDPADVPIQIPDRRVHLHHGDTKGTHRVLYHIAKRDERDRRDERERCDQVRGSKFRKPRTSALEPSPVPPFPPVSLFPLVTPIQYRRKFGTGRFQRSFRTAAQIAAKVSVRSGADRATNLTARPGAAVVETAPSTRPGRCSRIAASSTSRRFQISASTASPMTKSDAT